MVDLVCRGISIVSAMVEDLMQYKDIVERALKGVVREALEYVAVGGLPGEHHFYVSYLTGDPGVEIPSYLRERYPDEITIVIQHQFWDLEVTNEQFAVTLSFSGKSERLVVPFSTLTGFADPSVEFGLQFRTDEGQLPVGDNAPTTAAVSEVQDDGPDDGTAEVVVLDSFRKK